MVKITFIEHDGTRHEVTGPAGRSLMEVARLNGVPGIDADCGGACSCATCQVYIAEDWMTETGERTDMESLMLDFADNVQPNSRLSCQVKITDKLDGLIVVIPETQR